MGSVPTSCGARITKASSCWATIITATADGHDHASRFLFTCEAFSSTREITLSLYLSGF